MTILSKIKSPEELSGKLVTVTPKQKDFCKIENSLMFDKLWADPDAEIFSLAQNFYLIQLVRVVRLIQTKKNYLIDIFKVIKI